MQYQDEIIIILLSNYSTSRRGRRLDVPSPIEILLCIISRKYHYAF